MRCSADQFLWPFPLTRTILFVFNRGEGVSSDGVVSSQIHPIHKEAHVFTLCQDYKIRVWNCQVPCQCVIYCLLMCFTQG